MKIHELERSKLLALVRQHSSLCPQIWSYLSPDPQRHTCQVCGYLLYLLERKTKSMMFTLRSQIVDLQAKRVEIDCHGFEGPKIAKMP